MGKFLMVLSFLSANFIYQYFQVEPDYLIAAERFYFQSVAILFVLFYQKITGKIKPRGNHQSH